MARAIYKALNHKINIRYFWTDSSTVRNWIRATATFYQTFVSHRIGEIQTLTEPQEWRFVQGSLPRLGGRLGNARLPYDTLHPPLLSGRHSLGHKVVKLFHQRLKHCGVDLVLAYIKHHV